MARVFFSWIWPAAVCHDYGCFIENSSRLRTQKVVDGRACTIMNYRTHPRFSLFLLWPPYSIAGKKINVGTAIEGVCNICVCINGGRIGLKIYYAVNDHHNDFMSRKQFLTIKNVGHVIKCNIVVGRRAVNTITINTPYNV